MKLTEHEWVMLSHLLDQALELPEAAHEQWLESLAEPFVCLKPTLRAMLAQQRTPAPDAFLNTLPTFTGVPALAPDAIAPVEPGVAIGPYTLRQALGQGGMGAVSGQAHLKLEWVFLYGDRVICNQNPFVPRGCILWVCSQRHRFRTILPR